MFGGCTGDESVDTVPLPALIDLSGPLSENSIPIAEAESDTIKYLNEEGIYDYEFETPTQDVGYDVDEALQTYQGYRDEYEPAAILAAGTPDGKALVERVARDEICYMVPYDTVSLTSPEAPYSFVPHTTYADQVRAGLEIIEERDPGATVGFIYPDIPAGREIVPAISYIEELDLERGPELNHALDAATADPEISRASDEGVDYLISQTTVDAHTVILSSAAEVDPDITVVGITGTASEFRLEQSPELFDGHMFIHHLKTFQDVVDDDTEGSEMLVEMLDRYHDETPEEANPDLTGNLNYVRGMSIIDLVTRAFEISHEQGNDLTDGSALREAFFEIEDYEGWGLGAVRTLSEDDTRPSTSARLYELEDGEMVFQNERSVERRDEWIPDEL